MPILSNWGNFPKVNAQFFDFARIEDVKSILEDHHAIISRGAGLSYGDVSLGSSILSTTKFCQIIDFDESRGIITTEAGVTLDEVLKVIVPKGWFLPVTPGTKFITVGGAVAGDVHGKNHHGEGSFCKYVTQLQVLLSNGEVKTCSSTEHADLFNTVCAGLGLCGVILTIQFRLKPITSAYIRQRNVIVNNLDEMLNQLQHFNGATYSVAWIDCLAQGKHLGRGVLMLGEHASVEEVVNTEFLKIHKPPAFNVPFTFPSFVLNPVSIRLFNWLFFNKHRIAKKDFIVHYDKFFYPLDFVKNWNRMYGKEGFLQYQFVLPFDTAQKGLRTILDAISKTGMASFLAVLKAMGPGEYPLSFPIPGFTLALDFPVSNKIFPFLEMLDKQVIAFGGRIYLVKDARMSADTYWQGYQQANVFRNKVKLFDPSGKFSSALSKRLQMI